VTISVVIPTLDEAECIVEAVESAFDRSPARPGRLDEAWGPGGSDGATGQVEVVVVDGGSRDATRRRAEEAGARVLALPPRSKAASVMESAGPLASSKEGAGRAERGRAHQLRLGTERTKGEVLLFLHADTRLPAGWAAAVERALADPSVAGGAFALRFGERGGWERWIEFWVAVRVALLGLPYGDQALFVRRNVLDRMGGVPRVAMMEDLDLVRGIRRAGRLACLRQAVTTSSRRYRARGPLRTILWHQVALLGWWLGWDRARLAARMGR
jgi:rSAM/selenodomain-associated transferase 2